MIQLNDKIFKSREQQTFDVIDNSSYKKTFIFINKLRRRECIFK
jgi:hypothetical protein